jgi:hypothetical protein
MIALLYALLAFLPFAIGAAVAERGEEATLHNWRRYGFSNMDPWA